jgi:alkylation response protein AidB-like acyl-CoA dehydrogenase
MSLIQLIARLRSSVEDPMPLPGAGQTFLRHRRLMELGREDLSLARLAEAHWDAVAILAEAGRLSAPHAIYGVWASETPGSGLQLDAGDGIIKGSKMFCSGAELIDRALITVGSPEPLLFEIDLNKHRRFIRYDASSWKTTAFADTRTSTTCFDSMPVSPDDVIGDRGWYLGRPGFWHGACGPAACWAGGAIGLVDYAIQQTREDPHTLAHLGAMQAAAWALRAYLGVAGDEIDAAPCDAPHARIRALTVRHLVEQACTDILRRLPRAYGPHPLAMDKGVSRRYQELDLYLRQSHAERDLESLGRCSREE